jgi:CRISPR type I-E-associated protein CasB/Cse2
MNESYKHPVIQHLESLADKDNSDRAALAKLRRALQDPIEAYPIILPYLPRDINDDELSLYALLAGLFANQPQTTNFGNMGNHMREAAGENIEATERRFVNLLRSNREDLPVLLRQAVSFLRSKGIHANWEQLRKDLLAWNHPNGYVQKNWARAFWSYHSANNEPEKENQSQK